MRTNVHDLYDEHGSGEPTRTASVVVKQQGRGKVTSPGWARIRQVKRLQARLEARLDGRKYHRVIKESGNNRVRRELA